jgi:hypothetical protein
MSSDLILDLRQHIGKTVASVHVFGDAAHYARRCGDDEGLDTLVVTFTDGTSFYASYWTSEMGGLCVEEDD